MAAVTIKTEPLEKSWVEICDEEANLNSSDLDTKIKTEKEDDTYRTDHLSFENFIKKEIKQEKEDAPKKHISYANVVKCSPVNEETDACTNDVYTPSKVDFPETIDKERRRRSSRRQIQKEFLQEDLSLSSHLDVFHVESPNKIKTPKDEEMESPTKDLRKTISAKRRINSNPFYSAENNVPDDVLMPSPRKITRSSAKKPKLVLDMDTTRKRQRENSTPSREERESKYETNEEVLTRRQKQIDYGKNTIGYERYKQLVPKDKRDRKHPQTPPKHRKYSRRAWDGLVRVWRQRLHFWDPPSQGGGNPDCLDLGSLSDVSSCDTASVSSANSQSSTPWKESKRRVRMKQDSVSSTGSSSIDANDCVPLDNC